MDAIEPKKTLVEETYDALVDAICTRQLAPGARLNQEELASRLNVSRQPVNSAIALLKAQGLAEDTGRRSATVAPIDVELFRSIFEYRLAIEPVAAFLATERQPANAAALLRPILDRGQACVARQDLRDLQHADQAFHELLYKWSGNQVIQHSMRTNWLHIRRMLADLLGEHEKAQAVWEEHEAITDALLSGRPEQASAAMRAHILTAHARYQQPLFGAADLAPVTVKA